MPSEIRVVDDATGDGDAWVMEGSSPADLARAADAIRRGARTLVATDVVSARRVAAVMARLVEDES